MNEPDTTTPEIKSDQKFELTELDGDDSVPTHLHGFELLYQSDDAYAYSKCFEGYHLGVSDGDTEEVDPEFFGIELVENKTGLPGIATELIRASLEEAITRGFSRGRARIFNPKILTILEKMRDEGFVSDIECYLGDENRPIYFPASELAEKYSPVTSETAKQHLEMYPHTNDRVNEEAIAETVFKIINQAGLESKYQG